VLTVQVKGSPFLYSYNIEQSEIEEFKQKTIIQYSPQLLPNQTLVKDEGKAGFRIKTIRKVLGESGEFIREELISEDYYAPIEKIEVHGLKAGEPTSGDTSSVSGSDTENRSTNESTVDDDTS